MTDRLPSRIDHPSAWKGSDFRNGVDDVAFDMDERHRDALRAVVAGAAEAGVGLQELTGEHTRMPSIEQDLAEQGEDSKDDHGNDDRMKGRSTPLRLAHARCQADEYRRQTGRIGYHEERNECRGEDVEGGHLRPFAVPIIGAASCRPAGHVKAQLCETEAKGRNGIRHVL